MYSESCMLMCVDLMVTVLRMAQTTRWTSLNLGVALSKISMEGAICPLRFQEASAELGDTLR